MHYGNHLGQVPNRMLILAGAGVASASSYRAPVPPVDSPQTPMAIARYTAKRYDCHDAMHHWHTRFT